MKWSRPTWIRRSGKLTCIELGPLRMVTRRMPRSVYDRLESKGEPLNRYQRQQRIDELTELLVDLHLRR